MKNQVDLTNCDREPIHILGHVQTFGCLLAVSSDWIILHASRNIDSCLGRNAEDLIGVPLRDVISESGMKTLRDRVQYLSGQDAVERVFGVRLRDDTDDLFDTGMHMSGRSIVFEFEPHDKDSRKDYTSFVRPMIERIKRSTGVEELCNTAAKQVRSLTGFDRVMVYRFLPDDSGEVIAESAAPGLESFLGLRYPASDIPQQARQLYRRNLLRIISDVDDEVSPIIPETNAEGEPLDLSMSGLRSVSKIHLEYLRNMGVRASLSISIMKRGRLWGLFACHHYAPRVLSYGLRSASELFGQLFGFVLDQVEMDAAHEDATRARSLHDQLMVQLAEGESIEENFDAIAEALAAVIQCDGAAGWIDGKFHSRGVTPSEEEFLRLSRFLNTTATSQVYATDCLQDVYPPAADYRDRAAGLLALPVSRTPRDYIVLFRKEVARTVTWAGNPEKPAELGPHGARLTPRKSFEAWKELVQGHSEAWSPGDLQTAESLRVTLLEVVLRMSDAANRDRVRSQERQDLLIAELNHRVRNILNLIRSLVNQSSANAESVSDFTATVGGRIHALSRAHDLVTAKAWAAASLRQLIKTELDAYLGDKAGRVVIQGPDVLVKANAFTALALVVHELTTNSAKYGALSDSRGRIDVHLKQAEDDSLTLEWTEMDGPPVKAPTRRGFGSTVLDRSIPYDLGGTADVAYDFDGLKARFTVPAKHIEDFVSPEAAGGRSRAPSRTAEPQPVSQITGKALLVEDNMIIALDGEEFLKDLGATTVSVASTVAEALRLMAEDAPDWAVLDVNLGDETSAPIARELAEKGVPFVFVTGYGETSKILADFANAPVVSKPYDKDMLLDGLRRAKRSG